MTLALFLVFDPALVLLVRAVLLRLALGCLLGLLGLLGLLVAALPLEILVIARAVGS